MNKIEKNFDINMVLMMVFSSLEEVLQKKEIELIYDIESTLPKELRGDAEALFHFLTHLLALIFEHTKEQEMVLSLTAPKDFLYEEPVSFTLPSTGVESKIIEGFFENELKLEMEKLEGSVSFSSDASGTSIFLEIPFKINTLGNRRHYRLPDIGMMGKKVLLLCENIKISQSIEKMLRYFLYEVDSDRVKFKERGSNLAYYDIFIIEDSLITQGLATLIEKVQEVHPLKCVILRSATAVVDHERIESASLVKPVMQESIFELIIALFEDEVENRPAPSRHKVPVISMDKYINEVFLQRSKKLVRSVHESQNSSESLAKEESTPEVEEEVYTILDTTLGMENSRKMHCDYKAELEKFLETFDKSDRYFKQIVEGKMLWQVKQFCIDLEAQAKIIGAQSMLNFANQISILFTYDKADTLPLYVNKYHKELKALTTEIRDNLHFL
jgi:hypothetical protein